MLLKGAESSVAEVVAAATNTVGEPEHAVALVGVMTGTEGPVSTVTVTVVVPGIEQPVFVPVTVYVVVVVGSAVTTEPVVELNPVAGAHV